MAEIAPIAVAAVDKLGVSCSGSLEESSDAAGCCGDIQYPNRNMGLVYLPACTKCIQM